jgi:hypothetical protein
MGKNKNKGENFRAITQESPKISSLDDRLQAATQRLKKRPNVSSEIRTFFDEKKYGAIAKIVDFLVSDTVIEVDVLGQAGCLDENSYIQYVNILPEFQVAHNKMFHLVQGLVETLRSRFPLIAASAVRKDGRFDFRFIQSKVVKLFYSFYEFAPSFRRLLLDEAVENFFVLFWREMEEVFKADDFKDHYETVFEAQRKAVDVEYWSKKRRYLPECYYETRKHLHQTFKDLRLLRNIDALFPHFPEDVDLDDVEKEQQNQFKKIQELSRYRKILYTKNDVQVQDDLCSLTIFGDETVRVPGSLRSVCGVIIHLNPLCFSPSPQRSVDEFGNETVGLVGGGSNPGVLMCVVHRSNGSICFNGLLQFGLKEQLSRQNYLRIQQGIYTMLLKYLEGKDEDIEDVFSKADLLKPGTVGVVAAATRQQVTEIEEVTVPKPENIQTQIASDVDGAVLFDDEGMALDISDDSSPDFFESDEVVELPEGFENDPLLNSFSVESMKDGEQGRKGNYFKFFKGLKRKQILSALTRLVGKHKKRNSTSHVLFTSSRTGVTRAIPVHNKINLIILKSCLDDWGYSLADFLLKIPGVSKRIR